MEPDEFRQMYSAGRRDFTTEEDPKETTSIFSTTRLSMTNKDLSETTLSNTDFIGANLAGINLKNSTLLQTRLTDADLRRASLQDSFCENLIASNSNMSEVNARRADFTEALFYGTDLTNADFADTTLSGTIFNCAKLDKLILDGATMGHTVFSNVSLAGVVGLTNIHLTSDPIFIDSLTIDQTFKQLKDAPDKRAQINKFFQQCGVPRKVLNLYEKQLTHSVDLQQHLKDKIRDIPLKKHFILWDDIDPETITKFTTLLAQDPSEHEVHHFLKENPLLMIQHLSGGHGRWVIPAMSLGKEYEVDFVIGEKNSLGYHWTVVELESPRHSLFTKKGDPKSILNHAIRQITDWRSWFEANISYARRSEHEHGLGLRDITGDVPGLILIGRRSNDQATQIRRRRMSKDLRITIHTYDFLIDCAWDRVESLGKGKRPSRTN